MYAFDFDGTLAKIVRSPSDAKMSQTTEKLLKELSSLVPVAVVSSRAVEDIKKRIGFIPQYIIGNHSLNVLDQKRDVLEKAEKTCKNWKNVIDQGGFPAGVEIEDKVYSLAIHYRKSRAKKEALNSIKEIISKLSPRPRVVSGKSVVNIIPEGAPHKGSAVLDLIQRSRAKHVFYVGDDDSDEDIFNLDYADGQIMTVRVGEKKTSQAKYFIKHQSEINRVLTTLIRFHRPQTEAGL